jgi:hypothetical protein
LDLAATTDGKRNTLLPGDPVSVDPSVGLELAYNDFLFIRGGVGQFQKETDFDGSKYLISRPAIGVGMQLYSLRIEYAFSDLGDGNNRYSHIISLSLNLKPKKAENQ